MDTIKYLLSFIIKVVIGLFLAAGVWWLVSAMLPEGSVKSLFSFSGTATSSDWLPAPRNMNGLLTNNKVAKKTTSYPNTNHYRTKKVVNSRYQLVDSSLSGTVTTASTSVVKAPTVATSTKPVAVIAQPPSIPTTAVTTVNGYASKELYIRNLSIYEGGYVYTGLSFVGEARSTMFIQGRFPIVIADATGRAVAIATAYATTDWSVPGWVRFQTKITSALPNKVKCTMVFEQALMQGEQKQPTRVAIPVLCN